MVYLRLTVFSPIKTYVLFVRVYILNVFLLHHKYLLNWILHKIINKVLRIYDGLNLYIRNHTVTQVSSLQYEIFLILFA